jgi:hypothetical protein
MGRHMTKPVGKIRKLSGDHSYQESKSVNE